MTTTHDPLAPTADGVPVDASGWVEVDLDAIADNVRALRERSGPAALMAVVKADAYGHGLVPAAKAALAGGATWLGVAQLAEAKALRAAGIAAPVLTWIYPPGSDLAAAIAADIDLSVAAPWALDEVVAAARSLGRTARIHLKVDTGLGRGGSLGQGYSDLLPLVAAAQAEGAIEVVGIFSHFAFADAPEHPTVRTQADVFAAAISEAERHGIRPLIRHLANSAATLTNPAVHYDMVRPGIAVYGLSPVPDLGGPTDYGLREAMRVIGRFTLVKDAEAGQGVSYTHLYSTTEQTRLGLVPMGYADGVPRNAGAVGPVLADGRRLTVAGRVCMDQFMLDLGPGSSARAGDEVVLFGRSAHGEPSAQDWADATGTISYELITRMSGRLPKIYLGTGR
jgi:alanine racemase